MERSEAARLSGIRYIVMADSGFGSSLSPDPVPAYAEKLVQITHRRNSDQWRLSRPEGRSDSSSERQQHLPSQLRGRRWQRSHADRGAV